MVRWLVVRWSWSRDLVCHYAELVMTHYLRSCQDLEHHYVCVDGAWTEQLDSCPVRWFVMIEANEKMSLNGQRPLELDGVAVRRGHRVQFTVKMVPFSIDGRQHWPPWMRWSSCHGRVGCPGPIPKGH